VLVGGGGGGSGGTSNGLVDGLLSMLLWNQSGKDWHHPTPNGAPTPEPSTLADPETPDLELPSSPNAAQIPRQNPEKGI
jgi:hypothetical protein